ncbi:MAG: GNAT family N-acetyltransferase [Pseudonocardiaceae bacterium]
MPPSSVRAQLGAAATAQDGAHLSAVLRDIFEAPYQWPDNEETQFRRQLSRLATDATFGIATAQTDDELVGFAYGYTLRPDTTWWDGFVTPVPEELTKERERRAFALIDFAVAEGWRRHGIGRRLHDTLLTSRHEARATLAVEPAAHEARAVYERWSWRVVGRLRGPATDFAEIRHHGSRPTVARSPETVSVQLLVQVPYHRRNPTPRQPATDRPGGDVTCRVTALRHLHPPLSPRPIN